MEERVANDFSEYHNIIEERFRLSGHFRGVSDFNYQLIPSLGRHWRRLREHGFNDAQCREQEALCMQRFRDYCAPYTPATLCNDWELLAIAQHHGLPTRLLDWTTNALVALFFAVQKRTSQDSAVYCWDGDLPLIRPGSSSATTPLGTSHIVGYAPMHLSKRITAQDGLFTYHPDPLTEFMPDTIVRVRIPGEVRETMRTTLARYGINDHHVYQDLDAVCRMIRNMVDFENE